MEPVRIIEEPEVARCYDAISELRPHLTPESFLAKAKRQMAHGYRLAAVHADQGPFPAVAGFRLLENLGWGRFLYVDDLVTRSSDRRAGHADSLVAFLLKLAEEENCDQLHLDSGHQRHDAHAFYLRMGLRITGHHFAVEIKRP
jgi:ribosomal protein S18 acetylase RimI-like enzyme